MKRPALSFLFLVIMVAVSGRVLAGGEDVVYLKNGTVYRGKIIQFSDSGYQFKVKGTGMIFIPHDDVDNAGSVPVHGLLPYEYDSASRSFKKIRDSWRYYYYHERVYFLYQISVLSINGMRIEVGYRFNRYAALGIGIGAGYEVSLGEANFASNSGYSPVFLHLTGDMIKSKVTPFYSAEVGYLLPWFPNLSDPNDDGALRGPFATYKNYGGLTAGAGIGVRIYTRRWCNIMISLNMNSGFLRIATSTPHIDYISPGNYNFYTTNSTTNFILIEPSVRLGLCF